MLKKSLYRVYSTNRLCNYELKNNLRVTESLGYSPILE
ncbi:hypothetical protein P20429_1354 [Pseudoalteromonas sp. BSi20429]|nr:hypothetical protein P20429_1354 [Pseudoalteromonas sp. BSi20429]